MKLSKESRKLAKQLFHSSLSSGRLDAAKIRGLTASVIEKKPRDYVGVLKSYHRLLRLESEKFSARIESATPLTPETQATIQRDLETRFGSDLTLQFVENPELIGGLRIKIGNDVWDSTIKTRLDRLQGQLAV